jgi:hypothetical protein
MPHAPTQQDIAGIAAIADPALRNLEITWCYSRLSEAMALRTGACSNWCTFATWASRQAGATIRGEDMLDTLRRRLRLPADRQHPIRSMWRALLRRGVLRPETRLGRLIRAIHTPFDAFERTSDAVARGNLKVFAEIGREFARFLETCPMDAPADSPEVVRFLDSLAPGDPPDGQRYLRRAFTRYQQQRGVADAATRAGLIALANLEIGLHEQTRLQDEIRESLDAPLATMRDLHERLSRLFFWRRLPGKRAIGSALLALSAPFRRYAERVSREVITECLMVLALPSGALRLGQALAAPVPEALRTSTHEDLRALFERFEHCAPDRRNRGADDWSELDQRMHFILHLFCAFHEQRDLFSPPFSDDQMRDIQARRIPDGLV